MATQSRGQTGHSRVRVSYDMPGNRACSSSSSCSIPPLPSLHLPMQQQLYIFCCGCDCACLLTLEMAGDNDNLIMHGASQSGPAQPSPVQPGPAPTPLGFRTWLNQGGASSGFNGLAAIARWRFWWNFKCSLWPNEARVAADLTSLGLATLGSVVSKTASKCKLIN